MSEPEFELPDPTSPAYLDALAEIAHADTPGVEFHADGTMSDEVPDHGVNTPDEMEG